MLAPAEMPLMVLLLSNANRLSVAPTYAPAYIWKMLFSSDTIVGHDRMSGSGIKSWSSFSTRAFSVMSLPLLPVILTDATASGAASAFFSETGFMGRNGEPSQSSASIFSLIFWMSFGFSVSRFSLLATCCSTYGRNTLTMWSFSLSSWSCSMSRLNSGATSFGSGFLNLDRSLAATASR